MLNIILQNLIRIILLRVIGWFDEVTWGEIIMRRISLIFVVIVGIGGMILLLQGMGSSGNKKPETEEPSAETTNMVTNSTKCDGLGDTDLRTVQAKTLSDGLSQMLRMAVLTNPDLSEEQVQGILDQLDQIELLEADVHVEGIQHGAGHDLVIDQIILRDLRPVGTSCEQSFGSVSIGNLDFSKIDVKTNEK